MFKCDDSTFPSGSSCEVFHDAGDAREIQAHKLQKKCQDAKRLFTTIRRGRNSNNRPDDHSSQFVGCASMEIARKLSFPPYSRALPQGSHPREVLAPRVEVSCKGGRANLMTQHIGELNPPVRLMLTPGPSSIDPRVYRAMATPLVGHMDPWFKGCMDDTQILLRQIFQTENRITMPLSASGSGGIEASVVNTLEEGDEAIVAVNGIFSERMYEIATRASSKVTKVEAPYGNPVDAEDVRRAGNGKKIKIIGLAQGETSTGVLTGIAAFRKVADELGALLIVDTVASLAAVPLHVDRERIDICFSGSQKALSAPPGMSPITVSAAAEEVFRKRKTRVQSWYFDLTTAMNYWGKDRLYHHTPPISLIFALREAMRLVMEEGLEARWERHRVNQLALIAGLEAMGLKLLVENPADRLPTVTAVMIPSGVDDAKVRNQLLDEFNIEIAGGFGPIKGKIWRVGLMGYCSQKPFVLLFLAALEKCLMDQGFRVPSGAGVGAAVRNYSHAETATAVSR
jgi:alanine-glyoxylate transaminase/serine-glyoxylate transaminase/serine-pyruvate transaminase